MKTKLPTLAKKKGFESSFLYDKPYKYSSKEPLRWLFWLTEAQEWLRNTFNIFVEVESTEINSHRIHIRKQNEPISTRNGSFMGEYVDALKLGIDVALNTLPDVEK